MNEDQLTKKERKLQRKTERAEMRKREEAERRAQKKKTITIVIVSAVAIFAFLTWLIQNAPQGPSFTDDTPDQINPITDADHVLGASAETASVTIIEYGDYQCPPCGAYHPVLKKIMEEYGDQVRFVFRNLPIRTAHPNANLAAQYAEAAGLQGKFFEMHDLLYENQAEWSNSSARAARGQFEQYGETLGLDVDQLKTDAFSEDVAAIIETQRIDAIGAGAASTPTFVIDGTMLTPEENPPDYAAFVQLITGAPPVSEIELDGTGPEGALDVSVDEPAQ